MRTFRINGKEYVGYDVSIKDAIISDGVLVSGKLFIDGKHMTKVDVNDILKMAEELDYEG